VGFAPAILTRAGFTGELGYEIWTTPDYFATLYDDIWNAGQDLGLRHFGGRALSSLRLEKGYGSFNKDFRPITHPLKRGSTSSSISTSRISSGAPRRSPSATPDRGGGLW